MTTTKTAPSRLITRPQSYEEMAAREGFQVVLDQKQHTLDRILTDYEFPKVCRCGISTCGQWHKFGFLTRTVDGLETNVGHVCGRNTFGEEAFKKAKATYARERETEQLLSRAAQIKLETAGIRRRVEALEVAPFGAAWIVKVRAALAQVLGADLFESLRYAEQRGSLEVTETRLRTKAEVDRLVSITLRKREQLQVEETRIGSLVSMPWIKHDFSSLRKHLLDPLGSFQWAELADMSLPQLRQQVKQFDGMGETVAKAEEACASALAFFDPVNLALLARWVPERLSSRRDAVTAWAVSPACKELAGGIRQ